MADNKDENCLDENMLLAVEKSFAIPTANSSRMDIICELFLQCSHGEQLSILDYLPRLITRDFVSFLPSPLTARILYFLPLSDVLVCLRVSKRWLQLICECNPYWQGLAYSVGAIYTNGNAMTFAKQAWKHANRVRSLLSTGYISTVESKHLIHTESVRAYSGGRAQQRQYETCYAGRGNVLCLGKKPGSDALLLQVCLPGITLFTEKGLRVCSGWSVPWCFATVGSKFITFSTTDARWGKLEKDSSETEYKSLQFWNDLSPISLNEVHLAGCPRCTLISEVNRSAVEENKWSYRIITLNSSHRSVSSVSSTISLSLPIRTVDYVHLESVALIPQLDDKSKTRKEGPCTDHLFLLQFGSSIAVYKLAPGYDDPQQIILLCPENDPSYYVTSVLQLGHKFAISSDFSLVSLCTANTVHVWSLSKLDLISVFTLPVRFGSPYQWRCLAVGHLYSLVHNQHRVVVVCTMSGHIIQEFSPIKDNSIQDINKLCSPPDEKWINSVYGPVRRIILPVVKGGWYDPEYSIVIDIN